MTGNIFLLIKKDLWSLFKISNIGVVFAVLFTTIAVICYSLVESGVQVDRQKAEELSSLNLIEISSVSPNATRPVTRDDLPAIEEMQGVEAVYPQYQQILVLEEKAYWPDQMQNPGMILATPWIPEFAPELVAGTVGEAGPGDQQIILPQQVTGGSLDNLVGQTVPLYYQVAVAKHVGHMDPIDLEVVALADNSVIGKDGPQPAYISYPLLEELIERSGNGEHTTYYGAYVRVEKGHSVADVQNALGQQGYMVTSMADQLPQIYGLLAVLKYLSFGLFAVAAATILALGFLVGTAWYRYKMKDLALLKMLGYNRTHIFSVILGQLVLFGLLLAGITALLSIGGTWFFSQWIASTPDNMIGVSNSTLPPWPILLALFPLYPLALAIAGLLPARKISGCDMDVAFRDL